MRVSFAATNPCHLFPVAKEFATRGDLGVYYSGYPRWKLDLADDMSFRSFPLRTLITYGLLRCPDRFRPKNHDLFRWQDRNFDRLTANSLEECDAIHGIPGQCLETFRRARQLGITTVLNHATGPTCQLAATLEREFEAAGLEMGDHTAYDDAYHAREDEEYELADFHCVASSVVKDQLIAARGIGAERIWVIPYAADDQIFFPADGVTTNERAKFRILFAGQLSLRKGIRFLLEALQQIGDPRMELELYGAALPESADLLEQSPVKLRQFGAVSQQRLAAAMRSADVLVLPSIEEGFGLVVPQALNCGLPCIVSNAVGAADLIRHHQNGSLFPTRDSESLATELLYWQENRRRIDEKHSWEQSAAELHQKHIELLA